MRQTTAIYHNQQQPSEHKNALIYSWENKSAIVLVSFILQCTAIGGYSGTYTG
jgi:hypothetical protein